MMPNDSSISSQRTNDATAPDAHSAPPAAGGCPFKHVVRKSSIDLPEPKLGNILSTITDFSDAFLNKPVKDLLLHGDYKKTKSFAFTGAEIENPEQGIAHAVNEIHKAYRAMAKRFLKLIHQEYLPDDLQKAVGYFRESISDHYHLYQKDSNQVPPVVETAKKAIRIFERYEKAGKDLPIILNDHGTPVKIKLNSKTFTEIFALGWSGTSQIDDGRVPSVAQDFLTNRAAQANGITQITIPELLKAITKALRYQAHYTKTDARRLMEDNGLGIDFTALRENVQGDVRALQGAHHYACLGKAVSGADFVSYHTCFDDLLNYLHIRPGLYRVQSGAEAAPLLFALTDNTKNIQRIAHAENLDEVRRIIEDNHFLFGMLERAIETCLIYEAQEHLLALKPALPEKLQAMIPEPGVTVAGKHMANEKTRRMHKEMDEPGIDR